MRERSLAAAFTQALRQAEAGTPVDVYNPPHGHPRQRVLRLEKALQQLGAPEIRELHQLREENVKAHPVRRRNPTSSSAKNLPWTTLTDSPVSNYNVCSGAISSALYVAGGTNDGSPLRALEIYQVATNAWSAGRTMPDPVILPLSAVLNGQLLCFGGSNSSFPGSSYYSDVQAHQP